MYDIKNYVNLRGGNTFNYQHGRTRTNSNGWTSRYGQYLTHAHKHITRTVARYNSETAVHTSLGLITPSSICIIWHNNNTKAKSSDCQWLGHLQTNPEILGVAHNFFTRIGISSTRKRWICSLKPHPLFKLLFRREWLKVPSTNKGNAVSKMFVQSTLSNGHLYKTDTSLRWTPSVGPCRCSVILLWGEGWAVALGKVIDKKHMAHPPPPPSAKNDWPTPKARLEVAWPTP